MNIGVVGGFNGTTIVYGQAMFEGVQTAADLINKHGGVLGRQINPIAVNTAADPVDAVTAVRKMLAADAVSGAIGLAGLDWTNALPILNQSQMVFFEAIGDPAVDHLDMPYVFACRASDSVEGAAIAEYAYTLGYRRIAVVFDAGASAQTLVPSLLNAAQILGLQVVAKPDVPVGAPSYEAVVRQIIDSKPDVMLSQLDGKTAGTFFPELEALGGSKLPVIGTDITLDPNWIKAAGVDEYAKNIVSINSLTGASGPGPDVFNTAYSARYNKTAAYTSAFTYDAMNVEALAMLAAKSVDPKVYYKHVLDVTTPGAGATTVYDFATGADLLAKGMTIKYSGVATPMTQNKYHRVTATYAAQKGSASGQTSVIAPISADSLVPLIAGG